VGTQQILLIHKEEQSLQKYVSCWR
jgi:hypothetical protein